MRFAARHLVAARLMKMSFRPFGAFKTIGRQFLGLARALPTNRSYLRIDTQ
jgi:hypothetical protein